MNQSLYLRLIGGVCVVFQLSCDAGRVAAPPTSEQVPVTVKTRAAIAGEPVPAIHVWGGANRITFQVTRVALCLTIVDAGLSRAGHALSVVAHVWADPLADCFATSPPPVVDYGGALVVVAPGAYLVRIFEANGNETPRLLGSAVATVGAP
jgi:hypothetical protein